MGLSIIIGGTINGEMNGKPTTQKIKSINDDVIFADEIIFEQGIADAMIFEEETYAMLDEIDEDVFLQLE